MRHAVEYRMTAMPRDVLGDIKSLLIAKLWHCNWKRGWSEHLAVSHPHKRGGIAVWKKNAAVFPDDATSFAA